MLTIRRDALSEVSVSSLQPGELFAVSGGAGDFVAVVVDVDQNRFLSWLHLTGKNRFTLTAFESAGFAHAPKVLRLGLNWNDLQLQVDETRIKRIGVPPDIGCLLIAEHPSIIAKWGLSDYDGGGALGISLRNIAREHAIRGGYCCDKWQLVHAPAGLPPEVVAEFSPGAAAS